MASWPNSPGFAALNGIAAATASVPAIFAVAASVMVLPLRVGPLTVAFADVFAPVVERVPVLVEDLEGLRAGIIDTPRLKGAYRATGVPV
jgi:hypothetical protein